LLSILLRRRSKYAKAIRFGRPCAPTLKRSIVAIKILMKRLRARLRPAVTAPSAHSTPPILTSAISAVVVGWPRQPFGSLWLSSDPGTSSMGKLMALALTCTMAAAVLFQPALIGPPRARKY
jgi:predicted RND superfamily exporter protein